MNQNVKPDFAIVTEIAGQKVSAEQVMRVCHRYNWARTYIQDVDVAELACGAGQGLGFMSRVARSIRAGDVSPDVLDRARATYGSKFDLQVFDALKTPYADQSLDAVLLFEAIYYLLDTDAFMREARRILKPKGRLLIATANKDLFDFTPSEFSSRYFGVVELAQLCRKHDFSFNFFGYMDVSLVSARQRLLRPAKFVASRLNLMPKSMAGKERLKQLFFGEMTEMPAEIEGVPFQYGEPISLDSSQPDRRHKVVYCAAIKETE
jgi:SAM-dependent methyltransferase